MVYFAHSRIIMLEDIDLSSVLPLFLEENILTNFPNYNERPPTLTENARNYRGLNEDFMNSVYYLSLPDFWEKFITGTFAPFEKKYLSGVEFEENITVVPRLFRFQNYFYNYFQIWIYERRELLFEMSNIELLLYCNTKFLPLNITDNLNIKLNEMREQKIKSLLWNSRKNFITFVVHTELKITDKPSYVMSTTLFNEYLLREVCQYL